MIREVHTMIMREMRAKQWVKWTTFAKGISQVTIPLLCSVKSYNSLVFIKQMHAEIIKKGFDKDLLIGSALVDMYVQIGLIEVTRQVFDNLPVKDVILWTALIIGYVEHEHGEEALNLMKEMQTHNISPLESLW